MKLRRSLFLHGMQLIIGSIIGVGIFGLPYVAMQAGYAISLLHLVVLGFANLMLLFMVGELVMDLGTRARLTGIIRNYLGDHWAWFITLISFSVNWGAMIAYVIVGGEFLHALFAPTLGGPVLHYQVLYYAVSSLLLIGGLGLVSRIELVFVFLLLVMLLLMMIGALPKVDISHLTSININKWFVPFGVILFAFGGHGAVPEVAEILGKYRFTHLKKVIVASLSLVLLTYACFTAVVIGVSNSGTTPNAIVGLGAALGEWALALGSAVGLIAVFTSSLIIGLGTMNSLIHDFKQRYFVAWGMTILVPLLVFLAGARSFIEVIGFTGGIFASLVGLITIYTYMRAKDHPNTPKRYFTLPTAAIFFTWLVLLFGFVVTIVEVVRG